MGISHVNSPQLEQEKKIIITLATDYFPQVFPIYVRETIWKFQGIKNKYIYRESCKLPTYA